LTDVTNPAGCGRERSVIKEISSGEAGEAARAHVASCAGCQEAFRIAGWMQAFAAGAASLRPPRLPSAGALLWKFQLIEKREAARRAARPVFVAQIIASLIAAQTFLWLLWSGKLPFARQVGEHFSLALGSLEAVAAPLLFGFVCAALVCLLLLVALRRLLRDN
jgi:hypothetical protein